MITREEILNRVYYLNGKLDALERSVKGPWSGSRKRDEGERSAVLEELKWIELATGVSVKRNRSNVVKGDFRNKVAR